MKPLVNLEELELESHGSGSFRGSFAVVSDKIGAQKLGYNLTVCPPGYQVCPFHNHHSNEEMFLILEGEGTLRFGDKEYPLKKHDIIACPPGKKDVAHQIKNTGSEDLKYLSLSTKERAEVCEYPDSNKIGVIVGDYGDWAVRKMFKADSDVDYFEGE
jgi:uncharacterized cupin superfamily protein